MQSPPYLQLWNTILSGSSCECFAEWHWVHHHLCHAIAARLHFSFAHMIEPASLKLLCKLWNMFQCGTLNLGSTASVLLQWPYDFHFKFCIWSAYHDVTHVSVKGISLNTSAQWKTIAPVEYNSQTENKHISVVLACYITLQ